METFKKFLEMSRWKGKWTPPSKDALTRLKSYNNDNYFASFRARGNVMRINPNPLDPNTPFGIYAYQVPIIISTEINRMPLGTARPFIWVLTPKNPQRILHIHQPNDKAAEMWKEGRAQHYKIWSKQELPPPKEVEELIDAGPMTIRSKRIIKANPKPLTGKLHQFYLSKGIDGFVDHGTSTIHENEPYQAVFFGNQTINVVDVIPNNYRTSNDIAISGY